MKILLVLLNFALVSFLDRALETGQIAQMIEFLSVFFDEPVKTYQLFLFLAATSSFVTVSACVGVCKIKRVRGSSLILGYAVTHFVFICFYITMMERSAFDYLSYAFFDASYSLCNFILAYEFIMFLSGFWDAFTFIRNRFSYDGLGRHINQSFNSFVEVR